MSTSKLLSALLFSDVVVGFIQSAQISTNARFKLLVVVTIDLLSLVS